MNCQQAKEHLWEYYDGACDPAARIAIEGHLSTCAACRQSLDEWVALSQRVFSSKAVKAPAFLWTRVLAGIEAEEQRRPWWVQWRWMSRVAAAATVAVSAAMIYTLQATSENLEPLFEGQPAQQQAIQLASAKISTADDTADFVLEGVR